jgi:hypothetical protein
VNDLDINLSNHIDNITAAASDARAALIDQLAGNESIKPKTVHWVLGATAHNRLWQQVRERAAAKGLLLMDAAAQVAAEVSDQLRRTRPPLTKATFAGECEQVEWNAQHYFVRMVRQMKAEALK